MSDAPLFGCAALVDGVVEVDLGLGRPVRALVDTAGSVICMAQSVADELGLAVLEWLEQDDDVAAVLEAPKIAIGGFALDTDGLAAYGFDDLRPMGLAARRADITLPAPLLRRHHVVLDHPAGELLVGPLGSMERRGVAVPAVLDAASGVVVAAVEVDGEVLDLIVDSALTSSLAVDRVVRSWQSGHPDWPASAASVGPGNVAGLAAESRVPMLRVPQLTWGGFAVPEVAFAWRGDGDLSNDGALGANVLGLFRVDLDWAAGSIRLEQGRAFGGPDGDLVGVVLAVADEGWEVAAIVSGLADVHVGDELVAVDGTSVVDLPLPEVLRLLGGAPGEIRRLTLVRDEATVDVDAPVMRLL